jgi:membrane protease subunit HflK
VQSDEQGVVRRFGRMVRGAVIKAAEAYRENTINRALGDSSRFLAVLEEYQKAPEVNRVRLYLETMEKIGPKIKKYIISPRLNKGLIKIYGIGE